MSENGNGVMCGAYVYAAGVIFGFALTLAVFFVSAAVICLTPAGEGAYDAAVLLGTVAGVFSSGFISGAKGKFRGWLRGAAAGAVYAASLSGAAAVFGNPGLLRTVIFVFIAAIIGSAGGILGINMKKSKIF